MHAVSVEVCLLAGKRESHEVMREAASPHLMVQTKFLTKSLSECK